MKQLLATLLLLCTFGAMAQQFNKEIKTENGLQFLVGQINLEGLRSQPYGNWFQNRYESYNPDETMVALFKEKLAGYNIKLFLGTWCGDSSPTGEEKGLDIIKVPTIIFFKDGKEVNRIVESPLETLEEDMAQIIFQKDYVPNYAY